MQNSNWRVSIVDFMAVLGMNSSLTARKALAAKLNYSGYSADGSAEKNMWLHAELLKVLAQNGGKVPSNLL
jgi:alkyl sulfatase BDS1-like metallo-beta-lactamase superfamily hydrolase